MKNEEDYTREEQRMLIRAIGIAFVMVIVGMSLAFLVADKVFHLF